MPKPNKGESKDDFISRCVSDDEMMEKFPEQKQRLAVCYTYFEKANESKTRFERYLLENETIEEEEGEVDDWLSDLLELVFEFANSFDEDQLSDDQFELLEEILDMLDDEDEDDEDDVDEAKTEVVVRGGKKKRRVKPKKGFRVVDGKYVKMTPAEMTMRKKAAKRGARKRKSKKSVMAAKRKRSIALK